MHDLSAIETRLRKRQATIAVIGLGYVGLPLARTAIDAGFTVLGLDIDPAKVDALAAGRSYIKHVGDAVIAAMNATGRFRASSDFATLAEADAVLICVPTPLTRHREPDLSFVTATTAAIQPHVKPGQLIVLESTTYPGTTREVMKPILENDGLAAGRDFYLAYSPEREDPGNERFDTASIPKVVGGDGPDALRLATALYEGLVSQVVTVSSVEAAEATKLTENIFRAVNIALVNELKVVYAAMGIDIWEVIEAAKSKPFGFMPFYPGPGLGGHCIPIDPFYLTWKAREFDISTRFVELAGEINTAMPAYVVARLAASLGARQQRSLNGARILVMGIAYKKNVDDTRESPAFRILHDLEAQGAITEVYDPHVPVIPPTREHAAFAGRRSIDFTAEALARFDAALIVTDHDGVDYRLLADHLKLVVDTRNACARAGVTADHIVKA